MWSCCLDHYFNCLLKYIKNKKAEEMPFKTVLGNLKQKVFFVAQLCWATFKVQLFSERKLTNCFWKVKSNWVINKYSWVFSANLVGVYWMLRNSRSSHMWIVQTALDWNFLLVFASPFCINNCWRQQLYWK